MIVNNIINLFLDLVDKQDTSKQQLLDVSYGIENENDTQSLNELQFEGYSIQDEQSYYLSASTQIMNSQVQHLADYCEDELNQNTKIIQKQNSFLRYLIEIKDITIQQRYQSLYNSQYQISYSEIKKSITRKVNEKTTRWNFKLNSVVQSQNMQPLFYDYLKYQSKEWLKRSKVSNLEEHQALINDIIKQIEKEIPLKIKIYKKKK